MAGQAEAKKGDIVWLDGWGGILGEFVRYDEGRGELTLRFPRHLQWRYGDIRPRPFYPVKKGQITVLTPKQVLKKLSELFETRLKGLRTSLQSSVSDAIKRLVI